MGTFKRPENNDKCRQQDQSRCLAELMAFHTKLGNAPIVPTASYLPRYLHFVTIILSFALF